MRFLYHAFLLLMAGPAVTCCRGQAASAFVQEAFNATVSDSRKFSDPGSFPVHPASLSFCKGMGAAAFAEKRYGIRELLTGAASVALPAAKGAFGLTMDYSGFAAYNHAVLGLQYGRALGKALSMGTAINYTMLHAAGYGSDAAIGIALGLIMQATPELTCSVLVVNPAGSRFMHNSAERLPASFSMSMTYEPSDQLLLRVETFRNSGNGIDFRPRIHYAVAPDFFLRAGLNTLTGNFMAGCGLCWKGWRFDFIAGYQGQLGITPGLQLVTGFQKKPA